jgi:hypothetical protein
MSRQLTFNDVLIQLQQVLHNLHDLSQFGEGQPFQGVVISDLEFVWREEPLTHWTIRIEPSTPPHPRPLTEVLAELQEDEDAPIRTGPED